MKLRSAITLMLAMAVAGCAGPRASDYVAERPQLLLERYFDGEVEAHGIATDRAGRVVRRFVVAMTGRWNGDQGVLDETFRYSDGATERRVWRIVRVAPGRYVGRADDVIGEAHGEAAGNTLHWRYTLRLPVGESSYEIEFDDWMYRIDERVVLNKARMSKFGIRVGEVTLVFRKL